MKTLDLTRATGTITRPQAAAWLLYPLAVFFSALWTSAFVAGKLALVDIDAPTLLCSRFALAAALLLPAVALRARCARHHPDRAELAPAGNWLSSRTIGDGLLLGLLNNALTLGLVFTAMHHLSSALVVIITSCAPFVTLLISALMGFERATLLKIAGVGIGFAGVALIMGTRPLGEVDSYGVALTIIATLSFAAGTLVYRRRATGSDALALTFWQAVAGAALLAPLSHLQQWLYAATQSWLCMLYLAAAVSIGAVVLWLYLIRLSGAATASSYHLMNPVFGLLFGYFVFGDALRAIDAVGVALVAGGLLAATRVRADSGPQQPSPPSTTLRPPNPPAALHSAPGRHCLR